MRKRIDIIIFELCEEIDLLKEDCEYWKAEYKKVKEKYDKSLTNSIQQSHAMGLGMVAIATGDKELAAVVSKMD
jgi:hypothetical protein